MLNPSLQKRITALMITSSLLLIAGFSFIQLNSQQENLARFYAYWANLSGPIIKNNLEAIIRQKSSEELPAYLQTSLRLITQTLSARYTCLFDKDGIILASTEEKNINQPINSLELEKWPEIEKLYAQEKISLPEINRNKRELNLYIPLKKEPLDPITYVAKITFSLGTIQEALSTVLGTIIIAAIAIILANILLGYLLSRTVIGPIKMLNEVTKIISQGDLTVRTKIYTGDELEELGSTFNYMTEELIKMKERAENANPLTKLPGNIIIREQVEKRIQENRKFAVIYCDLNRFKSFNDEYGIARGDEAIKITAGVLKESIKHNGNPDDFIGHEGGDDFILLTTLEKSLAIAEAIIKDFTGKIVETYDPDDRQRGYIISKNRDGSSAKFPIMTISLAGVCNEYRLITSYAEVTNIAAEIKRKVKAAQESAFIMDQRKS